MKQLAGVALGANLGDPPAQLRWAFERLASLPHSRLLARSSLYRSAPIGPSGQPDYCNAAALLETSLAPEELLKALQSIEQEAGRSRASARWAARTLDLDLLFYGNQRLNTRKLTLPHPEIGQRNFVLTPLAEIAPAVSIPGLGVVATLAGTLSQQGLCLWP